MSRSGARREEALEGQSPLSTDGAPTGRIAPPTIDGSEPPVVLLPLPPLAAKALAEAQRLIAEGRLQEAAAAARRAREAAPTHPAVPDAVATALSRRGLKREALAQRLLACHLAPDDAALRRALVEALPGADFAGASVAIQAQLFRLLHAPDVSPLDVGPAVLSFIRTLPGYTRLSMPSGYLSMVAEPACQDLLQHPLWQALLARCLQTERQLEIMLTHLRRVALSRWQGGSADGLLTPGLEALAALALQANLGGFAWMEPPAETAGIAALETALANVPPRELDSRVLLLACYRPLPNLDLAVPEGRGMLRQAWDRLVEEPRQCTAQGLALPALTPVEDTTSMAVRGQYEANPYPRWLGTNLPQPRPLPDVLHGLFPELPAAGLPLAKPLRVLVAGCGTGEQSARTARRFSDAEVLAVDLSRASLGLAALRARQLGLGNIRFAQADILRLGGLAERFEVIEAMGVLHHMADPAAGWRVLRGLLAPGGVMRIGLYSRRARQPLAAVRRLVGAGDRQPVTAERLRAARMLMLERAAEPEVRFALDFLDAYDLDGLRDMLFHVQEHDFTLPEIARLLPDLGLRFLGFELTDRALAERFRQRHPAPEAQRDLALWDAFEQAEPTAFAAMYRFWCQAA